MITDLDFDFVIADRSYGSQDFVGNLIASGAQPVIPPNKNSKEPRQYDAWRYRVWDNGMTIKVRGIMPSLLELLCPVDDF